MLERLEIIEKYSDTEWAKWNWYDISQNPNITMEMVNADPTKPWEWNAISYNPNLTMEMILANPTKDWNWFGIAINTFIKDKEAIQ